MRPELKKLMEEDMVKLNFINWDRYYEDGENSAVFGWINREDSHEDFLLLKYVYNSPESKRKRKRIYYTDFSTSSAKHSEEIATILEFGSHNDCTRVEETFDIPNVIKLPK